jgi:hypothetical protein
MTVEIDNYEMDGAMLDMGPDMKILLNNSSKLMGKPNLVSSPIQVWLENKYKIYPIGQLEKAKVNIEGVKTKDDFEVIEIMNDFDPYPTLLGIDQAFENNVLWNMISDICHLISKPYA